jgi:hypothetical protein
MTRTRITAAVAGVLLTAAVVLSGCSAGGDEASTAGAAAPQNDSSGSGESKEGTTDGKAAPGTDGTGGAAQQPTVTRAIIKTGSLTVEADDVDKQRQAAITVVTGLRGLVSSEDTGGDSDGKITRANLVLKVPTASYETAIQRLSALGVRTAIHQESSDVTEQVVDVDSRIGSQRASLERIRTLLAKANTIGEIVSIETELTRREADLESLLAKQKALADQTELATLNLVLMKKNGEPPQDVVKDDTGFVAGLKDGWNAFTATFSALATGVGAVLPFAILFALIGVPIWRFRNRLRRTPGPVPATATATAGSGLPKHPDRLDEA